MEVDEPDPELACVAAEIDQCEKQTIIVNKQIEENVADITVTRDILQGDREGTAKLGPSLQAEYLRMFTALNARNTELLHEKHRLDDQLQSLRAKQQQLQARGNAASPPGGPTASHSTLDVRCCC
jgi:hypothetical protein